MSTHTIRCLRTGFALLFGFAAMVPIFVVGWLAYAISSRDLLLGKSLDLERSQAPFGWLDIFSTLLIVVAPLVAITSLLGFVVTTVYSRRRERREEAATRSTLKKQELEIEKLGLEIDQLRAVAREEAIRTDLGIEPRSVIADVTPADSPKQDGLRRVDQTRVPRSKEVDDSSGSVLS